MSPCPVPPTGWFCTRGAGHDGPCAAWPDLGDPAEAGRFLGQEKYRPLLDAILQGLGIPPHLTGGRGEG